jgi:hypothetical protein
MAVIVAVAAGVAPSVATAAQDLAASLLGTGGDGGYIVVLRDGMSPGVVASVARRVEASVERRYRNVG